MRDLVPNVLGFLASISLFGFLNYADFTRLVTCVDCSFPYGVPFTWFRGEDFSGGGGFVWSGFALNLLVVLTVGFAFTRVLEILITRKVWRVIGFPLSIGVFGLVNYYQVIHTIPCYHCSLGTPFTWFRRGGHAGDAGIVWSGLALNLVVTLCLGFMFFRLVEAVANRQPN
jgi:hypothetical protein